MSYHMGPLKPHPVKQRKVMQSSQGVMREMRGGGMSERQMTTMHKSMKTKKGMKHGGMYG